MKPNPPPTEPSGVPGVLPGTPNGEPDRGPGIEPGTPAGKKKKDRKK